MRRLTVVLWLGVAACSNTFPIPPGAMLQCVSSDECPEPLECDPDLGRCVDEVVSVRAVLRAEAYLLPHTQTFVFRADGSGRSPDGPLTIRWEELSDPNAESGTEIASDGGLALFHRFQVGRAEFCRGGGPCRRDLNRNVRLVVETDQGKRAERRLTVVVSNAPPVVELGESLLVGEDRRGSSITVDLCGGLSSGNCLTTDPDDAGAWITGVRAIGEPAAFAPVTADAGGAIDPRFTFPLPVTGRPVLIEADFTDGIETVSGRLAVYQGPHAWVSTSTADGPLRLHPDFVASATMQGPDAGSFNSPEAIVSDGQGGYYFGDSDPDLPGGPAVMVVHLSASLAELERWSVPGFADHTAQLLPSLVAPSGSTPGCAALRALAGGNFDGGAFVRFRSGQPFLQVAHVTPPGPQTPGAVHPIAATGDCWALSGLTGFQQTGTEVGRITASGVYSTVTSLAGATAASTVEPDGTLWVAERFPVPLSDGGFAPPVLARYRSVLTRIAPSGQATSFDYDGGYLSNLAARQDGGLWASNTTSDGLVFVEPDGTFRDVESPRVRVGAVFSPGGFAYDPPNQALWVTDLLAGRLYRFVEKGQGLEVAAILSGDDLPAGVNRASFGGRLALDPVRGTAVTFVGSRPRTYARWVSVPAHGQRIIKVPDTGALPGPFRGDPATGQVWSTARGRVEHLDVAGRRLLSVPHAFGPVGATLDPPVAVDRLGRAWVGSTAPAGLRIIAADGTEAQLSLPEPPVVVEIAGDFGCAITASGRPFRLTVGGAPQAQALDVGVVGSAAVSDNRPYDCAPLPTGDVWVMANQIASLPGGATLQRPHRVFRFLNGQTSGTQADISPAPTDPVTFLQVTGSGADRLSGDLYFTTWHFPGYESEIVQVTPSLTVTPRVILQGFVPALNLTRLGIGLDVSVRRVCAGAGACTELWVNNRVLEVHRFTPDGTDLEGFVLGGANEPRFSLVP